MELLMGKSPGDCIKYRAEISMSGEQQRAKEISSIDLIIQLYKKDVDRTLLRENLKLTPAQRVEKFGEFLRQQAALRGAFPKSAEES